MRRVLSYALALVLAGLVAVVAAPGSASAYHVDIVGVPSCLASNGTYSVDWTVTVPSDGWAQGWTVSLTASIALTPSTVVAGQTATGTGTGYAGSIAVLSVTNSWSNGAVEVNQGSVTAPTAGCTTPTTTTPTTSPATTPATSPTTTPPTEPTPTTGPGTTAPSAATPGAATPTDVCADLVGVQTSVPAGYVLRDGACVVDQAAAALPTSGPGDAAGSDGLLPVTGRGSLLALIAVEFVCLGALALIGARRMQRNGTLPPALARLLRFD